MQEYKNAAWFSFKHRNGAGWAGDGCIRAQWAGGVGTCLQSAPALGRSARANTNQIQAYQSILLTTNSGIRPLHPSGGAFGTIAPQLSTSTCRAAPLLRQRDWLTMEETTPSGNYGKPSNKREKSRKLSTTRKLQRSRSLNFLKS